MYLDIRMLNTWSKNSKKASIAPFEILYRFDGTRISKILYGLETGQQIAKESIWQEIINEQPESETLSEEKETEQTQHKLEEAQQPKEKEESAKEQDASQEEPEGIWDIQAQESVRQELRKEPLQQTEGQFYILLSSEADRLHVAEFAEGEGEQR